MKKTAKLSRKWVVFILFDSLIIVSLLIYFGIVRPFFHPPLKIKALLLHTPKEVKPFQLRDNHNLSFTQDNLKGHWTFMFFGFTHCEMICPTTLSALNKAYQILQTQLPTKFLPEIVFISIDPERDTIEKMNEYVTTFNPHFTGARGNAAETQALEKQLSINVKKIGDSFNHSTEILLLNPKAQIQAYFKYPHQPEQMAEDYKTIVTIQRLP